MLNGKMSYNRKQSPPELELAKMLVVDTPLDVSMDVELKDQQNRFKPKPNPKSQKFKLERKDFDSKFGIKPQNKKSNNYQVCKWHRSAPVEYFCNYANEFYCKLCIPERHQDHNDLPLCEIQSELQEEMNSLKHKYLTKRAHIMDRLLEHQNKLEDYAKIYYETLDTLRGQVLEKEYAIGKEITDYEGRLKKTLERVQGYSVVEFYYEADDLKSEVRKLVDDLDYFSVYTPSFSLKNVPDLDKMDAFVRSIQLDLETAFNTNIVKLDNKFSQNNYDYVINDLKNPKIA